MSVTMVGDVGPKAGIQRITYRSGQKTGHLTVIVSQRTAYMRGDAFALEGFLGFPHAGSVKYANTWLRFRHTAAAYAPIAENVTFRHHGRRPEARRAPHQRPAHEDRRTGGRRPPRHDPYPGPEGRADAVGRRSRRAAAGQRRHNGVRWLAEGRLHAMEQTRPRARAARFHRRRDRQGIGHGRLSEFTDRVDL